MKFLLDTNFLITAYENKIDIISELLKFGKPELCVIDLVIKELERFSTDKSKRSLHSRLSLKFIKNESVETIKTKGGHTDKKIVLKALNKKMVVCTNDKKLKESLLKKGIEVVTIRQNRYFVKIIPKKRLK